MPIIFYYHPGSDPCRAVMMAAQDIGVELVMEFVDVWEGEHLKPEFLKMNPLHTVPTISDDGFYLWDSHVIMTYLANKYAPDSPVYPKDPEKRAVVDKMLYFEIGTLFKAQRDFLIHHLFMGLPSDPEKEEALKKALGLLNEFLEKTPYAAGNHITLADYAILGTLTYLEKIGDYSVSAYTNVSAWMQKLKDEVPNYENINEVPLCKYKEYVKGRIPITKSWR